MEIVFDIEYSSEEDTITLFKSIEINQDNTEYIYYLMSNKTVYDSIEQIAEMYINKGIYSIIFHIIDGWIDNIIKIVNYENLDILTSRISKILIKIIRSDMIECENYYIKNLDKYFNIKYYAEKMIG
jgi:hypothetical protein